MNPDTSHVTAEKLAAFIDSKLDEDERRKVHRHLGECTQCVSAYHEALRVQALWTSTPKGVSIPQEELDLAKSIGDPSVAAPERPTTPQPRRRLMPAALAGAVAVVAFIAIAVLRTSTPAYTPPDPTGIPDPITRAVVNATARGFIIIPGGEAGISGSPTTLRSGTVDWNDTIATAMDGLSRRFVDGTASEDETYWLIAGYIATGRYEAAGDYLKVALERFPEDSGLLNLSAVRAYREGEFTDAESLLESGELKDNPVAMINLSAVLLRNGQVGRARELLRSVDSKYPDSKFATRARILMAGTP